MSKSSFRKWWDNTAHRFSDGEPAMELARIAWSAGSRKAVQLERAAQKRLKFDPPPTDAEAKEIIGVLTNQPPINWRRRAFKIQARALKAEAERDEAKKLCADINLYASHGTNCKIYSGFGLPLPDCTCGLDALRAEIGKGK